MAKKIKMVILFNTSPSKKDYWTLNIEIAEKLDCVQINTAGMKSKLK